MRAVLLVVALVVVEPSRPPRRNDDVLFVNVHSDEEWVARVNRLVSWTKDSWSLQRSSRFQSETGPGPTSLRIG